MHSNSTINMCVGLPCYKCSAPGLIRSHSARQAHAPATQCSTYHEELVGHAEHAKLTTAPMQTIPWYFPERAMFLATTGSSKAPGTQATCGRRGQDVSCRQISHFNDKSHINISSCYAVLFERLMRALQQLLCDQRVEPRDHHSEFVLWTGCDSALVYGRGDLQRRTAGTAGEAHG
jgi:hypothetical protein